jgi:hypothetical protein
MSSNVSCLGMRDFGLESSKSPLSSPVAVQFGREDLSDVCGRKLALETSSKGGFWNPCRCLELVVLDNGAMIVGVISRSGDTLSSVWSCV